MFFFVFRYSFDVKTDLTVALVIRKCLETVHVCSKIIRWLVMAEISDRGDLCAVNLVTAANLVKLLGKLTHFVLPIKL